MKRSLFVPCVLVLGLSACSSSTTSGGGSSSGTPAVDGGADGSATPSGDGGSRRWCGAPKLPDQSSDACEACLNEACCKEADACGASADCATCLTSSPIPPACVQVAEFTAVAKCVESTGKPACQAQCGGGSSGGSSSGGVCKQENDICQPLGGECCVGYTCCEKTSPPSCQTNAACL
ncbi:MAG: hypothetical protein KC657_14295 [Myxococcales bacterium]|nr:hypothetical protein [Myxococcales bacterium]